MVSEGIVITKKGISTTYFDNNKPKSFIDKLARGGQTMLSAVSVGDITSNIKNPIGDKIVTSIANHPFISASVATIAIKAAPIVAGAVSKSNIVMTSQKTISSPYTSALLGGAVGVGIASLFGSKSGSGGNATPTQNIVPTTNPIQTTQSEQKINPIINNNQRQYTYTYNTTYGDNSGISSYLNPNLTTPNNFNPVQNTNPIQDTTSDTSGSQTATGGEGGSSGISWLTLAIASAAAYLIFKEWLQWEDEEGLQEQEV